MPLRLPWTVSLLKHLTTMNKTPFDEIILEFWSKMTSTKPDQLSDTFFIVFSWLKILRVAYLQMLTSSEIFHSEMEALRNGPKGTRTQTTEDMLMSPDKTIACKLSYFQFINQINISGRILGGKGYVSPLYARIYFFRNKIIEHWDDYLKFFTTMGDGLVFNRNKIPIPFYNHAGSIGLLANEKILRNEFSKLGVKGLVLKNRWYDHYSNMIFEALEKIDPNLGKIPESLVEALFQTSFPTPIHNMEAYVEDLAGWIKTIPV